MGSCNVPGCGKSFTEYSSLYKHKSVHSVKPCFSCDVCGKTYRQMATLEKHRRTHDGKGPIADVCLPSDVNSCLVVIADDVISDDAINLAEIVIDNNDKEELAKMMEDEDRIVKNEQSEFTISDTVDV